MAPKRGAKKKPLKTEEAPAPPVRVTRSSTRKSSEFIYERNFCISANSSEVTKSSGANSTPSGSEKVAATSKRRSSRYKTRSSLSKRDVSESGENEALSIGTKASTDTSNSAVSEEPSV